MIYTVLWLLCDFLSLKNDVNVPSKRNMHKNFLLHLKDTDEMSGIRSRIWRRIRTKMSRTWNTGYYIYLYSLVPEAWAPSVSGGSWPPSVPPAASPAAPAPTACCNPSQRETELKKIQNTNVKTINSFFSRVFPVKTESEFIARYGSGSALEAQGSQQIHRFLTFWVGS